MHFDWRQIEISLQQVISLDAKILVQASRNRQTTIGKPELLGGYYFQNIAPTNWIKARLQIMKAIGTLFGYS